MRDVVVIGGGLAGLSACYELEKHKIRYTLIEVKPRLGGSIISSEEQGFVMDGGAFAIQDDGIRDTVAAIGLDPDALFDMGGQTVGFTAGTESLIHTLADKLTQGRLMRMAVSSIGHMDNRFTICMENGIMYDAGSLIIASPARFTERMFYTFVPTISDHLRDYHYDTIFRVSLGYHKRDVPNQLDEIYDMCFPFAFMTDHASRVPDSDHVLIQVGVRAHQTTPHEQVINEVIQRYGLGDHPIVQRVHYWSEADPLSCYDDQHGNILQTIRESLPDGVYLVGSDYMETCPQHKGVVSLRERIEQGQVVATSAINYLKGRKHGNS